LVLVALAFAQSPAEPSSASTDVPVIVQAPVQVPVQAPAPQAQASTVAPTVVVNGPTSNGSNTGAEPNPPQGPKIDPVTMNWVVIGIMSATILVGLAWIFAGYRLLKPALFIAGFILFYYIGYNVLSNFTKLADWINMCISAGAGILGGVLLVLVFKIGVFIMGFIFGAVVAIVVVSFTPLNSLIVSNVSNSMWTYWVFLGCIVGLGILVGIFAIVLTRPIVIFVTSWNGAFLVMSAIDRLTNWNKLHIISGIFSHAVPFRSLSWTDYQTYVIFGGLIVLALAGIVIQAKFTARNHHHDPEVMKNRKPRGEDDIPLLEP